MQEEKEQLRHNANVDSCPHRPGLQSSCKSLVSVKPTGAALKSSSNLGTIESKVSPARKFFDDYKLADSNGQARVLGRGGYSCVHLGCHVPSAQLYAVKVVTKRYLLKRDIGNIRRETSIHSRLAHANVVRFIEHFEDADAIKMIVEHCEGGDLQQYMQRPGGHNTLSGKSARHIFQHIVKALAYVHEQGIIHCDVKPQNVLFATNDPSSVIKLCDFGLSRPATDTRYWRRSGSVSKVPFEGKIGSAGYVAPEMYKCKHFDQAIDMWALGIMLFRCLVGYAPFYPASKCATEKVNFHKSDWEGVSDQCKDFLRKLLQPRPEERLTAMAALSHPWITT